MIIKYLNEGAFGSYKNKTSKEDKLKNLKDETKRIIDKAFKDLDFKIKKAVHDTICGDDPDNPYEGILDDVGAFGQMWDNTYDFAENNNGEQLKCNFQTEYKVNKEKDAVNIFTRIPVYAIAFNGHGPNTAQNCIFLDDMITDSHSSKPVNLKGLLVKAEENMYFSYHELNEEICDWFGVSHVYWYYRLHLVSRRKPNRLFNENIFYQNVAIFDSNFKDFIHDVIEAFEWFNMQCNVLRCGDILLNCNNDTNCKILGEMSKWIKTNELQLQFSNDNNIESLGDYHRLFLSEEDNKKLCSVVISPSFMYKQKGIVDLFCKPMFKIKDGNPVLKYPVKNNIFSDKLLNNLFGLDNESMLKLSSTEITDEPGWKCTQILYTINNPIDTLKVFCAKVK